MAFSTSKFLAKRLYQRTSLLTPRLARMFASKVWKSPEAAIADIPDGASITMGGFGLCGLPENLIAAIRRKGTRDLTVISNEAGLEGHGIDQILTTRQVKKIVCSFVGNNHNFEHQYFGGELEVELVPQGSFAEKLRAGGAGIPAFYTKTGVGSIVGDGGIVQKFKPGGKDVEKVSLGKEMRIFDGERYIMVHSIRSDFGFVKGWKADELGNVIFKKSALNFNADCAKAAR